MKCTFTAMKISTRYVGAKMAALWGWNRSYEFTVHVFCFHLAETVYSVGKSALQKLLFQTNLRSLALSRLPAYPWLRNKTLICIYFFSEKSTWKCLRVCQSTGRSSRIAGNGNNIPIIILVLKSLKENVCHLLLWIVRGKRDAECSICLANWRQMISAQNWFRVYSDSGN